MSEGGPVKREPREQQRTLFRGLSRSKVALELSLARVWGTVAGVDEVGRGCLAGPVVAAAVILPPEIRIRGITDSKLLSPEKREKLDKEIRRHAVALGVGCVEPEEIDRVNILNASLKAMAMAVDQLGSKPGFVLVDGVFKIPQVGTPQQVVIKGDFRCRCIGAASIVAKVWRDRLMASLDAVHPGYGFAEHKGYSCPTHRAALRALGASPIHRKTFFGVLPPEAIEDAQEELEFEEMGRVELSPARARRIAALKGGVSGEEQAAEHLANQGWRILDKRWKGGGGELDLVAAKPAVLAFVEVKTRSRSGPWSPLESLTPAKLRRLTGAAKAWLLAHPHQAKGLAPRFDLITIAGAEIAHLEAAFDADGE